MSNNEKWTPTPEQKEILAAEGNVLVSASAGSGKTTVMVQKIIDELKRDIPVEEILVMSYTNASAADMRAKIVEKLFKEVRDGDYSDDMREKLRTQLDNLPFSEIGTMDAFCGKLIRENFEALGISPRVTQMDEAESKEAKLRIIEKIIDEEYEKQDVEFIKVVNKIAGIVDDAPFSEIVLKLFNAAAINPEPDKFKQLLKDSATDNPYSVYGRIILDYYVDIARERLFFAEQAIQYLNLSGAPTYAEAYFASVENLRALASITSANEATMAIDSLVAVNVRGGDISGEDKAWVQEIRKSVKTIADGIKNDLFVDYVGYNAGDIKKIIGEVLRIEEEFEKRYAAYKVENDKIDFNDLSRYAITLLSDDERAKAVASKYGCIFVDEYQDINPLQECILGKLAAGNTFMVGDVKQSIYAFRNADAKIFADKKKLFESNSELGRALQMTKNFRSNDNILEFADRVFGAVMSENHGGVNYSEESKFLSDKTIDTADMRQSVEVNLYSPLKTDMQSKIKGVYSVASHEEASDAETAASYLEGAEVAKKIKLLINSRTRGGKVQQTNYRDVAILFRKRKGAEGFLRALTDAKIPYVSDGFTDDGGIKYIKQLINLLRVLDNSDNDVALVGFLLSYFGGMTEGEVSAVRRNSHAAVIEEVRAADNDKCRNALDFIKKWRSRSAYVPVGSLLTEIIADTGFDAYVLSRENGADEYRAVCEFVAEVKRLQGGSDVQSYLNYLKNADERDTVLPPLEEGNAVRISTVHGSKGLEYPVVFLARADAGAGTRTRSDILFDKDLGVGIKLYNETTRTKIPSLAYTALALAAKRRDADENIRLMYVALTRAKDVLIITAKSTSSTVGRLTYPKSVTEATSFLDLILYAGAKDDAVRNVIGGVTELSPIETEKGEKALAVFNAPEKIYTDEIEKVVNYVYKYQPSTTIGLKYTVSELNRQSDDTVYVPSVIKNDGTDMRRTGIAYHTVMENIDLSFTTLSEVNAFIEDLCDKGLLTRADADAVDGKKILACINNPVIKEGIRGRYLREQPFMLRVKACDAAETEAADDILVQGTADLVFLGKENAVVDFKYSTLPDEKLAEKYEKQLNLYKIAVETAFRINVTKKLLYSFTSGHFIEIK